VELWIERDELAAADEAHPRSIELPDGATLADALARVAAVGFLPEDSGLHTWWVIADGPVAVVSSRVPYHRFLAAPDAPAPATLRFWHLPDHGLVPVALTRDSVATAHDAPAPHADQQLISADATLGRLVDIVARSWYLASISGGHATWVALVGPVPVAVVAQQWQTPRWLADPSLPVPPAVHFRYLAQHNPEAVHAELGHR
jgi:hypothetical protein